MYSRPKSTNISLEQLQQLGFIDVNKEEIVRESAHIMVDENDEKEINHKPVNPAEHTRRTNNVLKIISCKSCGTVWKRSPNNKMGNSNITHHILMNHYNASMELIRYLHPNEFGRQRSIWSPQTYLNSPSSSISVTQNDNQFETTHSSTSSTTSIQSTNSDFKSFRYSLLKSIVRLFSTKSISYNTVDDDAFLDFLEIATGQRIRFTIHEYQRELNRLSEEVMNAVFTSLRLSHRQVTVAFDGFTGINQHKLINIMLMDGVHEYYYTTINEGYQPDTYQTEVQFIEPLLKRLRDVNNIHIVGIVTDNAGNVTRASQTMADNLGMIRMGCAAHQLQLIVMRFLDLAQLNGKMQIFYKIIGTFVDNKKFRNALHLATNTVLQKPNRTRWYSHFMSFSKLQELKVYILAALRADPIGHRILETVDDETWAILDDVVLFLKFMKDLVDSLQSSHGTLYAVTQCYATINSRLRTYESQPNRYFKSDTIKQLRWKSELDPTIQKWTEDTIQSIPFRAAQFLSLEANESRIHHDEIEVIKDLVVHKGANYLLKSQIYSYEKSYEDLQIILREQFHQFKGRSGDFYVDVKSSMQYNASQYDTVIYWQDKLHNPNTSELASVALMILNLVPTEASAERSFSAMKFILSPLRNHLQNEHVIDELRIRFNTRFSNYKTNLSPSSDFAQILSDASE